MPKVRPLTSAQREEESKKALCKEIMDRLNEKRGRERKTNAAFAEELGITRATWYRWNNGELPSCEFGKLLTALHRSGLTLVLS